MPNWKHILAVMEVYHRKDGYVDEVDGKLTFFDSDPCRNGVSACYVTIEQVREYAKEKT